MGFSIAQFMRRLLSKNKHHAVLKLLTFLFTHFCWTYAHIYRAPGMAPEECPTNTEAGRLAWKLYTLHACTVKGELYLRTQTRREGQALRCLFCVQVTDSFSLLVSCPVSWALSSILAGQTSSRRGGV